MKKYWQNFGIICSLVLLIACSDENKDLIPAVKKDFCAGIHRNDSITLSSQLKGLEEKMRNKTGVYVLEEGDVSMISRAWLSEYAEKSIDIQYFIFSTDNVGLIACDYLVRAADRGVKVRILVDDIMVEAGPHEILAMDAHPNIEIKIYNPGVNLGKNIFQKLNAFRKDFSGANQRMHNKIFAVDGKITITGGRNIADEYFDYDHEYNFRDRDVLLIGKATEVVESSFENFWQNAIAVQVSELVNDSTVKTNDANRYDRLHQYACNPENFWPQVREKIQGIPQAFKNIQASGDLLWTDSVVFVSDVPGKFNETVKRSGEALTTGALASLIQNAKTDVYIQSPYLITNDKILNLLKRTVAKGVKMNILSNSLSSTDNLEAFAAYQKCREDILKAGVRIFEFRPDAAARYKIMTGVLQKTLSFKPVFGLHAKSMVIDDYITVIGTFNLDPRSANLNTECVTIIYSKQVAMAVKAHMIEEIKPENAWETTLQYNPDEKAGTLKRMKTFTRKVVPKSIL